MQKNILVGLFLIFCSGKVFSSYATMSDFYYKNDKNKRYCKNDVVQNELQNMQENSDYGLYLQNQGKLFYDWVHNAQSTRYPSLALYSPQLSLVYSPVRIVVRGKNLGFKTLLFEQKNVQGVIYSSVIVKK